MSGLLFPKPQAIKNPMTDIQAQAPIPVAERSGSELAALSAEQRARFTRRKGRAYSDLSGGVGAGPIRVSRTLGSVART